MTNPIDEEAYEDSAPRTSEEVKQGNPGRPQSDFAGPDDGADTPEARSKDATSDEAAKI